MKNYLVENLVHNDKNFVKEDILQWLKSCQNHIYAEAPRKWLLTSETEELSISESLSYICLINLMDLGVFFFF